MVRNIFRQSRQIFEKQQNSILSAAAIITVAVFLSALLGIIRDRIFISFFFQNPATKAALDAYWVAFRLPDTIFQLLVIGALSASFIPVYSKISQKNQKQANLVASSMINLILLLFLFLSVLAFIFTKQLNQLFTGENFSAQQLHLAVNFTRIMLVAQFFFAVSNFMTGIIQANQRFLIPALSPLAYNLGIIAGAVILGPHIGLYGPTIGVVIGAFAHFVLQVPLALKLGFKYSPVIRLNQKGVRDILSLMLPRTLALSIDQIHPYIMVYLATHLAIGSLTLINLAQRLMSIPVRIFGMPIGQASFPFLSKESSTKDLSTFVLTLSNSLNQILYLAVPASVMLVILRIPAVRLAYGAKSFAWQDTLLTGKVVAILSLGAFAHAAIQLLSRAFYALKDTLTPFVVTLVSTCITILCSFYLVFIAKLGLVGIATGSTLGVYFQAILLLTFIIYKVKAFDFYLLVLTPIKIIFTSALMGFFLWMPMRLLDEFVFDTTKTLNLILLTILVCFVGFLVYFFLSKLLRIKELDSYLKLIQKIGNWKKALSTTQETIEQAPQTF